MIYRELVRQSFQISNFLYIYTIYPSPL
jgi:hypothetical protein